MHALLRLALVPKGCNFIAPLTLIWQFPIALFFHLYPTIILESCACVSLILRPRPELFQVNINTRSEFQKKVEEEGIRVLWYNQDACVRDRISVNRAVMLFHVSGVPNCLLPSRTQKPKIIWHPLQPPESFFFLIYFQRKLLHVFVYTQDYA